MPPLASLVGLRSRSLTFFFFCSLISPFLVVFLVLGCVSRAEQLPSPYDLFVWDQVVQTDQLIFRTLLPLSTTLPRICVLLFLRRTHRRPINTKHATEYLPATFSSINREYYEVKLFL